MKEKYMLLAIDEAKKAMNNGEIPVGAVIVKNNEIIASGFNQKENKKCSIYHAEIIAILEATKKCENWRLNDCDIYVTLEPCPMCASAIKQSRFKNVYIGLRSDDNVSSQIVKNIFENSDENNKVSYEFDICSDMIKKIMQSFFCLRRK